MVIPRARINNAVRPPRPRRVGLTLIGLVLGFGASCDRHEAAVQNWARPALSAKPASPTDGVAALVDGVPIFASEVAQQAAAEGVTPAQALQTLISIEGMVHVALAHRVGEGNEGDEAWKQILAQAWLTKTFEPESAEEKIPSEVLREVYNRGRNAFVHSRLVRMAILDLYAFDKQGPLRRQEAGQWAKELSQQLRSTSRWTLEELHTLAEEQKWSSRGLRFGVTWQAETQPYSETVGKAVQGLHDWGQMTEVIEDSAGFHIAMYIGEKVASRQTFEQAAPTLRKTLALPWRQRRLAEITETLRAQAGVAVMPEALVRQTLRQ